MNTSHNTFLYWVYMALKEQPTRANLPYCKPEIDAAIWNVEHSIGVHVTWRDELNRPQYTGREANGNTFCIPFRGWTTGPAFVHERKFAAVRVAGWSRPIPVSWIIHTEGDWASNDDRVEA